MAAAFGCGPAETNINRTGGLGEPCGPGGTCDFGLICVASRCRSSYDYGDNATGGDPATSGDPASGDPGGQGDPMAGDPSPGDPGTPGDPTTGDPATPGDPASGDPGTPGDPGGGCTIEGVTFDAGEAACAIEFFETMDCGECDALFDQRICEDAINDPVACTIDGTCTQCTDSDTRADGVTCAEIEGYTQFATTAANALLAYVQTNPCE